MANILFIKTSSLGDVIHHMPAIAEARRHLPDARFAWVVEEAFAPLLRLYPAGDEVIPVAARGGRGGGARPPPPPPAPPRGGELAPKPAFALDPPRLGSRYPRVAAHRLDG